ncbi:hypothetical protein HMPREF1401_00686 [Helicobacter pylori GAM120Ai]|uniref:Transposase n=1 Tax=Helicobacter pylori GAM120Ai TaxID=1159029 RepID=A0AAV3IG35_HELPX|nr:hypothetical protein HMPREF1401_00686 [Helicobacter pylori GAM120Ai]
MRSCIKRVCFKKLIELPLFKSGFGKSFKVKFKKTEKDYYSKLWLFCQALPHSYNKAATNGLQARLKLELVSAKKALALKTKTHLKRLL